MAKKIKLQDKNGVQLIPVTRSTTVEMNDGVNLQTAYEGINSSHYTKAEINTAGYLQSFTETDPTVPSYVKGITQTDITNWNSVKPKYIFTFEDNVGPVPTTEDYSSLSIRITNGEIVEGHTITLGSPNGAEDIYYLQSYNFSGDDFITFINGKGTRVLTFMNGGTPTVTSIDYITPTQLNNASYVSKTELNAAGYLTSFTETDPTVPTHVKSITQQNISDWDSKVSYDGGDMNSVTLQTLNINASKNAPGSDDPGINFNTNNKIFTGTDLKSTLVNNNTDYKFTREVNGEVAVLSDLNSYLKSDTLNTTLSSYATSANYDSSTKKIYLKHGTTTLSEIDATDFIKDGMVDTAYVQGANLVISFNTDAGKEAVNVPIANIFNANNYYTKSEIDNASYVQWVEKNEHEQNTNTLSANVITLSSSTDRYIYGNGGIRFDDAGLRLVPNGNELMISDVNDDTTQYYFREDKRGDVAITEDITDAINSYVISASYLQSFTETDPTVPTHVKSITEQNITNWNTAHTNSHTHSNKTVIDGITSTDISNWNSKTDNVGTITGITMNGTSKGTSGVVDLGTVITSHQSLENYVTKSDLNSAAYLQSFTETDPTVPAHVKSITQQNITDWNNKLSSETQLSKGTTTGNGNAVTDISVSNHQITLTKGSTFLTAHQNIKTVNNNTLVGTGNVTINELPTVSSTDNGKVLQVVNGAWTLVSPVTMYSGTGAPDNSQGNNGDLYMQI